MTENSQPIKLQRTGDCGVASPDCPRNTDAPKAQGALWKRMYRKNQRNSEFTGTRLCVLDMPEQLHP